MAEHSGETRTLCEHLAAARVEDLPLEAVRAGRRGVLDWLGVALAGSRHPTIDRLMAVLEALGSQPRATVLGRARKLGLLEAPLANGQMGHVLDFDDTHMGGVIFHGGSPILPALFALAERRSISGRELLLAYVVGFEAGVRVGQSAPGHHRAGWHLTGTLGTLAAGTAAGKLLELDARQLTYALGIAATQAAGLQQNRGTMCKSLHAGKAASNGVLAALLAEQGFDSSTEIVEGARGFSRVFSDVAAPERLVEQLGQSWEIARNGHKPYACGVVLHPAIDAAIRIRNEVAVEPATIERVEARVHPLVLQITGVAEPTSGLQSKFSIFHSIAVALLDGAAGINQFGDSRAAARDVVELRERVRVEADPTLATDQAEVSLVVGGQRHSVFVEHASGTAENPMSDGDLEAKFRANSEPLIGSERSARVRALVARLENLADVRELIEACA